MHETNRKEVYAVTAGGLAGREEPGASRRIKVRTGVRRASHRYIAPREDVRLLLNQVSSFPREHDHCPYTRGGNQLMWGGGTQDLAVVVTITVVVFVVIVVIVLYLHS